MLEGVGEARGENDRRMHGDRIGTRSEEPEPSHEEANGEGDALYIVIEHVVSSDTLSGRWVEDGWILGTWNCILGGVMSLALLELH